MNKPHTTHFFILSYDSVTKEWRHDVEQEENCLLDGTIHDETNDIWSSGYMGDGDYNALDLVLEEKIQASIDHLNTPTNES